MTPRYAEFAPRADLTPYVACVWVFEGRDPEIQRIAPDGRCELIVHHGTPISNWRRAAGSVSRRCSSQAS